MLDLYNTAGCWASNKYKDEGINNELWLQTSPGVFQDRATAAGVGEPCTRGRYATVADFNNDGLPDMFYSDHWPAVMPAMSRQSRSTDVPNSWSRTVVTKKGQPWLNPTDCLERHRASSS